MPVVNETAQPTIKARRFAAACLYVLFCFASSGFFYKNLGLAGVAAYAVAVAVCGGLWWRFREPVQQWLNRRFLLWAIAFAMGLIAVFAIAYPIENTKGPGHSSDRDDGLNIAVERMEHGQLPYYPPHPKAGPLSVFPGGILLATPFALMGNSAYQNLFWVAVFLWLTIRLHGRRSEVLLLAGMAFALCPALQYEFISGGDMLANGIYVAVALCLFLRFWTTDRKGWLPRLATVVFLGVALASRPNYLLLLPLVGGAVWRWGGFRRAVGGSALAAFVSVAITVPFYLADPAGFTPLVAGNKLVLIDQHLPWGSHVVQGASALASVAAGLWLILGRKSVNRSRVFMLVAWVTAVPMIATVLLFSVIHGAPDFGFMHPRYGLMYLFPALWAWALIVPFDFQRIPQSLRST